MLFAKPIRMLVALLVLTRLAWACPFCSGPTMTLSQRYQEASVVAIARCAVEKGQAEDEDSPRYVIQSVERNSGEAIAAGKELVLMHTAKPGARVLLLGARVGSGEDQMLLWDEPVDLSDAVWDYIRESPLPAKTGRLAYFTPHLEHAESTIANDAWGEFANAPYEDIVPIAKEFPAKRLRGWLNDPKVPAMRHSLYGMMLGLCGQGADRAELERRALTLEGPDSVALGIDGITGGYLLLAGERGLGKLEQEVLHNPKASRYAVMDRVRAVEFMYRYGGGKISPERLQQSLRPLLDRHDVAESIIPDLSRWKDWSVVDKVAALYGQPTFKQMGQRTSVLLYLLTCSRDVPRDSKALPEHAAAALKHLDRLKAKDPKFVEAKLKLYAVVPVKKSGEESGESSPAEGKSKP